LRFLSLISFLVLLLPDGSSKLPFFEELDCSRAEIDGPAAAEGDLDAGTVFSLVLFFYE